MFLFNMNRPITSHINVKYPSYKPKIDSHVSHEVTPLPSPIKWTRRHFETAFFNEDEVMDSFSLNDSFIDTLAFSNRTTSNTLIAKKNSFDTLCKNVYYLGYFFNKWWRKLVCSSGFLNWFHHWIVIRHRHFYRWK